MNFIEKFLAFLLWWQRRHDSYDTGKFEKLKTTKTSIKPYISEKLVKKQSFYNKNEQNQIMNKEVMAKRTLINKIIKFCSNL